MRSFTVAQRRARLGVRHFLTRPLGATTDAVTSALLGLHATDPATPYLTLWARIPGFTCADLDDALYHRRSVVKQLAMRRTLWVVPTGALADVLAGPGARVAEREWRKLAADIEKAGVTDDGDTWLRSAVDAAVRYVAVAGPSPAADIRAAVPELAGHYDPAPGKSYGGATPVAPRVLTVAAAQGRLVRGPNDGRWTTSRPRWAETAQWLGRVPATGSADDALAALVAGWLRAFGPATPADVTWWFGTTVTAARRALATVGAVEVDLHGTPGVALPDDLDDEPEPEPWGALLPALDVTTMGWANRDWYLGPHRPHVFDGNGNAGPTAWWNGAVAGGWCQDADGRVQLQLLDDIGADGQQTLHRHADELTAWLAGTRVNPRFPSPLSKRGATR
ncbi:winged helix DNA-binding domain-containing protein [Mycobacterium sp. MYCO198283]|uniref:winged helix DNA-binding domain-containing protein n=1 Tax=Mycobacterium sp. MYCO198283 TaxID=2883505 RepID=UPI001E2A992D|nr:winged helix DNA-binding domain-containing protein [Mycobacterium sp. MYCO198283]MCG5433454.1 winged helix DNA-binding domain-containing protein [Mycobacterium sp. MYCO198283]